MPESKRIALVMDWHPNSIGGVQAHVRDLAQRLKARGHEVFIVSRKVGLADIKALEDEGHVTVKPLISLDIILVPPDPRDVENALRRISPDIVHSHHIFSLTSLYSLKSSHELGIPRVITNHTIQIGYEKQELWRILSFFLPTRYYLKYAQAVISVSRAADMIVEAIMGDSVPRYIVPNAVDTERFRPPEREAERKIILFVGRLVYRKGPHILIRAFARAAREDREAELHIVGKGMMEPLLRVLASRLGVQDRVVFHGAVPERLKPELYRRSTIVAVPSILNESFGIVALEGMASGRPVVATRHGGLAEIIEHGRTGLLVKPGSSEELASSLLLLLQDSQLRKRLGENGRRVAVERYSWDVVLTRLLEIYNAVVSSGGG